MSGPSPTNRPHGNIALFACNFLSKGWEVSILGMLAVVLDKQKLPLYLVAILPTIFIVSQITISLFAGKIAHAIHSRNVILLSVTASGLSWLALFFSGQVIALLYLAYTLGGISSGLFEPIGNSLVAKLSHAKNRGTAIGNFAAFGDMGRIALMAGSAALAGFFGVGHACVVFLSSAVVVFILVDTLIPKATNGADAEVEEIPVQLGDLLQNKRFCFATLAGMADSFSSASLYFYIPYLLTAKDIPLADTLYFNVVFFAGYMSGRLALGRLADRCGTANTVIWSKLVMAVLIVLLIFSSGKPMIVLMLFLVGIFTRGSSPIIRAMVADSMDERISFHNAFSAYSFASRGASAVCRPIAGVLLTCSGIASVFYLASAVSLLTLYPAAMYKRRCHPADSAPLKP